LPCSVGGGQTLAVAESCTGGLVASRITDVAGSSEVFTGGFIVYSNAAKEEQLGVSRNLLDAFGAVSQEAARAMAMGCLQRSGAGVALATTGIAGPGGATPQACWHACSWACASHSGVRRAAC